MVKRNKRNKKMKLKTKELTTCALFAALIAIGAFIKVDIPLPMYTMHFTFQWFFVLMAGFLLGSKLATVSVIVYLCIGLAGVPVLAAFVIGTITETIGKHHKGVYLFASVAGLVSYYAIGAVYFYCMNNFYTATPVSWGVVIVQYCLITIAPDFILCVLATAFSIKLRPVFLGLTNECNMDRKVV